jgi:hypothetical protein
MGIPQTPRRRNRLRTQHRNRNTPVISCQTQTRTCRPGPCSRHTIQTAHRHRHHGYRLATILVIAILGTATPVKAADNHAIYGGIMVDDYYTALARCETGLNWKHSTKSYTGGLGIHRQTFRTWSNYNSAKGLTPRQQVKVADAIAFTSHIERSGRKVWRVGPWGWGCLRGQPSIQQYICQSKHPLVQRWKRHCQ